MAGGITYVVAKQYLARVTDNGIDPNDQRVMDRTNEATKVILDTLTPVNGMLTVQMNAINGNVLLLPKEMENAIDVEVLPGQSVRGQTDNTRAFYDIINQFAYVDPLMAHDNPLVDNGLVPDSVDPTILHRQYTYPGLQPNSSVRITGAKRFLPITQDSDYLIVQNIEAIKLVILSIERYENNDPGNAKTYRDQGIELLTAEVKKHLLDPRNIMARKAAYEDDFSNYAPGSFGHTRARIALEVPGAMLFGKLEIGRILNEAERRIMDAGMFRGCMKEFHADVSRGLIYFPRDVDSILAAEQCGLPVDVRSIFFTYLENGPSHFHGFSTEGQWRNWGSFFEFLQDKGEEYFPASRNTRRKFELVGGPDPSTPMRMTFVAKLKWVEKQPNDQMVIKHFEGLRLMTTAIVMERKEDWNNAVANQQMAFKVLQDDLDTYLKGIKHTPAVECYTFGMGDVGEPL